MNAIEELELERRPVRIHPLAWVLFVFMVVEWAAVEIAARNDAPLGALLVRFGALEPSLVWRRHELYRLLVAPFVHSHGQLALSGAMVYAFLSFQLERRLEATRVAAVFLIAAVASSIASSKYGHGIECGAFGAVSGTGAFALARLVTQGESAKGEWRAALAALAWIGFSLVLASVEASKATGFAGLGAGVGAGAILGFIWGKPSRPDWLARAIVSVGLVLVVFCVFVAFGQALRDPSWAVEAAERAYQSGELAESAAIAREGTSFASGEARAKLYFLEGRAVARSDPRAARHLLEESFKIKPTPEPAGLLAEIALVESDAKSALEWARKAGSLARDAKVLLATGRTLGASGQFLAAREALWSAESFAKPEDQAEIALLAKPIADGLAEPFARAFAEGEHLAAAGVDAGARMAYNTAIATSPDHARAALAYRQLARAHFRLRAFKEAGEAFEAALKHEPSARTAADVLALDFESVSWLSGPDGLKVLEHAAIWGRVAKDKPLEAAGTWLVHHPESLPYAHDLHSEWVALRNRANPDDLVAFASRVRFLLVSCGPLPDGPFEPGVFAAIDTLRIATIGWRELAPAAREHASPGTRGIVVDFIFVNVGTEPQLLPRIELTDGAATVERTRKASEGIVPPGERVFVSYEYELPLIARGPLVARVLVAGSRNDAHVPFTLGDKPVSVAPPAPLPEESAGYGDRLEHGGVTLTLNGVSNVAKTELAEPRPGNRFIAVEVTFENKSSVAAEVPVLFSYLVERSGQAHAYNVMLSFSLEGALEANVKLAPGEKKRGKMPFEVPASARSGLVLRVTQQLEAAQFRVSLPDLPDPSTR